MKLYLIAGEHSGDFIGANLINALKSNHQKYSQYNIKLYGIGGPRMQGAGINSLFSIDDINLMGFIEICPHILKIRKLIKHTVKDILYQNVDMVITIDCPGFTYPVVKLVKKTSPHIKLIHIVAPSVWAYKATRAKKYAMIYDHLMTLFPFEPKYFLMEGLQSTCIGHPVLEQTFYRQSSRLREEMHINHNAQVIAMTPGSRKQELKNHMPIIRMVCDELFSIYNIHVIFIQSNDCYITYIKKFLIGAKFSFAFSTNRLKAFAVSDCALAKSGTNALEIAASGTPQIVGYKLNPITFFLVKKMLYINFVSIINLIENKQIIPEYLQDQFNVKNIVQALSNLLQNTDARKRQVSTALKVLHSIGLNSKTKPTVQAANIIFNMLK